MVIDLDVTYAHTETFIIHVLTTYNAGSSAYSATVSVHMQNSQPPSINMLTTYTGLSLQLRAVYKYSFSPITCSTSECVVQNYRVSSSSYSIVPITGLSGPTYSASSGKYEISVDTNTLKEGANKYAFYIYVELADFVPLISAYSNKIEIIVECGSELLSSSQTTLSLGPYD